MTLNMFFLSMCAMCIFFSLWLDLWMYNFVTTFNERTSLSWHYFYLDILSRLIFVSMFRMTSRESSNRLFFNFYFLSSFSFFISQNLPLKKMARKFMHANTYIFTKQYTVIWFGKLTTKVIVAYFNWTFKAFSKYAPFPDIEIATLWVTCVIWCKRRSNWWSC